MNYLENTSKTTQATYSSEQNLSIQLQQEISLNDHFIDPFCKQLKTKLPKKTFPHLNNEQIKQVESLLNSEVTVTFLEKTCTFKLIDFFNDLIKKDVKKILSVEIVGGFVRKVIASSSEYCAEILKDLLVEPLNERDPQEWFRSDKNLNDIDIRIFLSHDSKTSCLREYITAIDQFLANLFKTNQEMIIQKAYHKRYVPKSGMNEQITSYSMVRFGSVTVPFSCKPIPLEILFVCQLERFNLFTVDAFQLNISKVFGINKKIAIAEPQISLVRSLTDPWQSSYDWSSKIVQAFNPETVDKSGFTQLISYLVRGWVPANFGFVNDFIRKFLREAYEDQFTLLLKALDNHHSDHPNAAIFFICNYNFLISKPFPQYLCKDLLQRAVQNEDQKCPALIMKGLLSPTIHYRFLESVIGASCFIELFKITKDQFRPHICLRKIEENLNISFRLQKEEDSCLLLPFQPQNLIQKLSKIKGKENEAYCAELYESVKEDAAGQKDSLFSEYISNFKAEYEHLAAFLKAPFNKKPLLLKLLSLDLYCAFHSSGIMNAEIFEGVFGQPFYKTDFENSAFLKALGRCLLATLDQKAAQRVFEVYLQLFDIQSINNQHNLFDHLGKNSLVFWKSLLQNPHIPIDKKANLLNWMEERKILTYGNQRKSYLKSIYKLCKQSYNVEQNFDKLIKLAPTSYCEVRKFVTSTVRGETKSISANNLDKAWTKLKDASYKKFFNLVEYCNCLLSLIESYFSINKSKHSFELFLLATREIKKIPLCNSKNLILSKLKEIAKKFVVAYPKKIKEILSEIKVEELSLNAQSLFSEMLSRYSNQWEGFFKDTNLSVADKYDIFLLAKKEKILSLKENTDMFIEMCLQLLNQYETKEKGEKILLKLIKSAPENEKVKQLAENYFTAKSKDCNTDALKQLLENLKSKEIKNCLGNECLKYKVFILKTLLSMKEFDLFFTVFEQTMKEEERGLFYPQLTQLIRELVSNSLQSSPITKHKSKFQFQLVKNKELEIFFKILRVQNFNELHHDLHSLWTSNPEWSLKVIEESKIVDTVFLELLISAILNSNLNEEKLIDLFVQSNVKIYELPQCWEKFTGLVKSLIRTGNNFNKLSNVINKLPIKKSDLWKEICDVYPKLPKEMDISDFWKLFDSCVIQTQFDLPVYLENAEPLCLVIADMIKRETGSNNKFFIIQIFKYCEDSESVLSKLLVSSICPEARFKLFESFCLASIQFKFKDESLKLLKNFANTFEQNIFQLECDLAKSICSPFEKKLFLELALILEQRIENSSNKKLIIIVLEEGLKKIKARDNKISEAISNILNQTYDKYKEDISFLSEIARLSYSCLDKQIQKKVFFYFSKLLINREEHTIIDCLNLFLTNLFHSENDDTALDLGFLSENLNYNEFISLDNQENLIFLRAIKEGKLTLKGTLHFAFGNKEKNLFAYKIWLTLLFKMAEGIVSNKIICSDSHKMNLIQLFEMIGSQDQEAAAKARKICIVLLEGILENTEIPIMDVITLYKKSIRLNCYRSWEKGAQTHLVSHLTNEISKTDASMEIKEGDKIETVEKLNLLINGMLGKYNSKQLVLKNVSEFNLITDLLDHSLSFIKEIVFQLFDSKRGNGCENYIFCKFISECIYLSNIIAKILLRVKFPQEKLVSVDLEKITTLSQNYKTEVLGLLQQLYNWIESYIPVKYDRPRDMMRRLICSADLHLIDLLFFENIFSPEWLNKNIETLLSAQPPLFTKNGYWVFPGLEKVLDFICLITNQNTIKDDSLLAKERQKADYELINKVFEAVIKKLFLVDKSLENEYSPCFFVDRSHYRDHRNQKLLIERLITLFFSYSMSHVSKECYMGFVDIADSFFNNWKVNLHLTIFNVEYPSRLICHQYNRIGLDILHRCLEIGVFINRNDVYYNLLQEFLNVMLDNFEFSSLGTPLINYCRIFELIRGVVDSNTWLGSQLKISEQKELLPKIKEMRKQIFELWIEKLKPVQGIYFIDDQEQMKNNQYSYFKEWMRGWKEAGMKKVELNELIEKFLKLADSEGITKI